MSNVTLGYAYFPDPTKGRPVFKGSIFVGKIDTDPEVLGNQVQVTLVQEDGTRVKVSQPINTSAGGVPEHNGSPVKIEAAGPYSLKVLNKLGSQVYLDPNSSTDDDPVNVRIFGTVGDGDTDDSAAIIEAIEFCMENGRKLYFPNGTYLFEEPKGSQLGTGTDRSITIEFAAGAWIVHKTQLPNPGSIQLWDFGGSDSVVEIYGFKFYGHRDTRPKDYTDNGTVGSTKVIGADRRTNMIRTNGCRRVVIKDPYFLEVHGNCFSDNSSQRVTIENPLVDGCSAQALKTATAGFASFTDGILKDIAPVPDSFLVDSVAATIDDGDDWHMQFGDAITINGGAGIMSQNFVENVSRTAFLGETEAHDIIISDNTIINDNANLKCGNPHGAIWTELGRQASVNNNLILQKLRYDTEIPWRSIVIAPAQSGQVSETYNVNNNTVIHYNYRTGNSSDKCLFIAAENNVANRTLISGNTFIRLGTNAQSETIVVKQGGASNGSLEFISNFIYQEGASATTRAFNFNVDTPNPLFEQIIISGNTIWSPNKPSFTQTLDYSIRFDPTIDFSGMILIIRDNNFVAAMDGLYLNSFDGKILVVEDNNMSGFEIDCTVDQYAIIDNNQIDGGNISELTINGGNKPSSFSGNTHFGRLDFNPNINKLRAKNNSFMADTTHNVAVILNTGGAYADLFFSGNDFIATANSQTLCRVVDADDFTRCSLSMNEFSSGGFSSVISYNWINAGTLTDSVVGGNIQLGTAEAGSGAPRNVGI